MGSLTDLFLTLNEEGKVVLSIDRPVGWNASEETSIEFTPQPDGYEISARGTTEAEARLFLSNSSSGGGLGSNSGKKYALNKDNKTLVFESASLVEIEERAAMEEQEKEKEQRVVPKKTTPTSAGVPVPRPRLSFSPTVLQLPSLHAALDEAKGNVDVEGVRNVAVEKFGALLDSVKENTPEYQRLKKILLDLRDKPLAGGPSKEAIATILQDFIEAAKSVAREGLVSSESGSSTSPSSTSTPPPEGEEEGGIPPPPPPPPPPPMPMGLPSILENRPLIIPKSDKPAERQETAQQRLDRERNEAIAKRKKPDEEAGNLTPAVAEFLKSIRDEFSVEIPEGSTAAYVPNSFDEALRQQDLLRRSQKTRVENFAADGVEAFKLAEAEIFYRSINIGGAKSKTASRSPWAPYVDELNTQAPLRAFQEAYSEISEHVQPFERIIFETTLLVFEFLCQRWDSIDDVLAARFREFQLNLWKLEDSKTKQTVAPALVVAQDALFYFWIPSSVSELNTPKFNTLFYPGAKSPWVKPDAWLLFDKITIEYAKIVEQELLLIPGANSDRITKPIEDRFFAYMQRGMDKLFGDEASAKLLGNTDVRLLLRFYLYSRLDVHIAWQFAGCGALVDMKVGSTLQAENLDYYRYRVQKRYDEIDAPIAENNKLTGANHPLVSSTNTLFLLDSNGRSTSPYRNREEAEKQLANRTAPLPKEYRGDYYHVDDPKKMREDLSNISAGITATFNRLYENFSSVWILVVGRNILGVDRRSSADDVSKLNARLQNALLEICRAHFERATEKVQLVLTPPSDEETSANINKYSIRANMINKLLLYFKNNSLELWMEYRLFKGAYANELMNFLSAYFQPVLKLYTDSALSERFNYQRTEKSRLARVKLEQGFEIGGVGVAESEGEQQRERSGLPVKSKINSKKS